MSRTSTLLASLTIAGLAGSAQASITLFADNFDRSATVETDLNASTTGQSGTLGALNWTEVANSGDPYIEDNTLKLGEDGAGGGWSLAYVDHNFTDAAITTGGEFTVSVDVSGIAFTGNTRFHGFAVGQSQAEVDGWNVNVPTSFPSDFFFGLDTSGGGSFGFYTVANGTQSLVSSSVPTGGVAEISATFTLSDFNSGSTVNYEVFIDGSSADTGSFTWSGTNENYVALYSNYPSSVNTVDNRSIMDNFQVSAVPEPSSLALLGLGGLAVARRRRG